MEVTGSLRKSCQVPTGSPARIPTGLLSCMKKKKKKKKKKKNTILECLLFFGNVRKLEWTTFT